MKKKTAVRENGFVLVMMVAILFVVSYLLLMMSAQIQSRVRSYEITVANMRLDILEKTGLREIESFLSTAEMTDESYMGWVLGNGAHMEVSIMKSDMELMISYRILHDGLSRQRQLRYCLQRQILMF